MDHSHRHHSRKLKAFCQVAAVVELLLAYQTTVLMAGEAAE